LSDGLSFRPSKREDQPRGESVFSESRPWWPTQAASAFRQPSDDGQESAGARHGDCR